MMVTVLCVWILLNRDDKTDLQIADWPIKSNNTSGTKEGT